MQFFTWHMPPFLSVMGFFYIIVALPSLLAIVRAGYWRGVWRQITQLIYQHWWRLGLVVAVVLWSIAWWDVPVTRFVKHLDHITHSYTFWDFICSCAEGGFVAGWLFTLSQLADYFKRKYLAEVCRISLMASIYGGLSNGLLKFIFNRQRPAIGLEQWHFFAFFTSKDHQLNDLMYAFNSMPSGHTITTVAALISFYCSYPKAWVKVACWWWALMVAFARIYTINHWLSDVMLASVLGVIIGYAVFQTNRHRLATRT